MNIFFLDNDAKQCAEYNCDVHCNKIVLEISQMLANCFTLERLILAPLTKAGTVRKHSHVNHPISKWTKESLGNMIWAIEHAFYLEEERLFRGYNPHFSHTFNKWALDNIKDAIVPVGELKEFATAIGPSNSCTKIPEFSTMSVVDKYRSYYKMDKSFVTWTRRQVPSWFDRYSTTSN